jgi:hypothetical protein
MKGIYFMEIEAEEEGDDTTTAEDMTISVCALTGITSPSTLQLDTRLGTTRMNALIDSGSTHFFVDAATTSRLGLRMEERPSLTVGVANGERIPALGVCKDVTIQIGTEPFVLDLYIIHLGGYELVLGCAWLRTHTNLVGFCPPGGTITRSSGTASTRRLSSASRRSSSPNR